MNKKITTATLLVAFLCCFSFNVALAQSVNAVEIKEVYSTAGKQLRAIKQEMLNILKGVPGVSDESFVIQEALTESTVFQFLKVEHDVERLEPKPDGEGRIPAQLQELIGPNGLLVHIVVSNQPLKMELDDKVIYDERTSTWLGYRIEVGEDIQQETREALKNLVMLWTQTKLLENSSRDEG